MLIRKIIFVRVVGLVVDVPVVVDSDAEPCVNYYWPADTPCEDTTEAPCEPQRITAVPCIEETTTEPCIEETTTEPCLVETTTPCPPTTPCPEDSSATVARSF